MTSSNKFDSFTKFAKKLLQNKKLSVVQDIAKASMLSRQKSDAVLAPQNLWMRSDIIRGHNLIKRQQLRIVKSVKISLPDPYILKTEQNEELKIEDNPCENYSPQVVMSYEILPVKNQVSQAPSQITHVTEQSK